MLRPACTVKYSLIPVPITYWSSSCLGLKNTSLSDLDCCRVFLSCIECPFTIKPDHLITGSVRTLHVVTCTVMGQSQGREIAASRPQSQPVTNQFLSCIECPVHISHLFHNIPQFTTQCVSPPSSRFGPVDRNWGDGPAQSMHSARVQDTEL
jgi:hypothetical protein